MFFFLVVLCGLQDLCSPIRDQTQDTEVKVVSPYHCTSRELPQLLILMGLVFGFHFVTVLSE